MKTSQLSTIALVVAALGLAACSDSSTGVNAATLADSTITADVATSSGDAIATSIESMTANEASASLDVSTFASFNLVPSNSPNRTLTFDRTRTCYDANGAVVAGCSPLSSVRKIVTHVSMSGSRSGTNTTTGGATVTWSGAVHRVGDDTITRNFNASNVEVSRTHSGVGSGTDTTSFSTTDASRNMAEAFIDSVNAVTWNVPRSSNPFPISGSIVRRDTIHVVLTKSGSTTTRDAVRRVEVDFPADAQGNVTIKVNDKTCSLNLVSHKVSGCQ